MIQPLSRNDQMHHFLKIKFAFADKIFIWIFYKEESEQDISSIMCPKYSF